VAHVNKVLQSIETDNGGRCVDIFIRPDNTHGFEEYRRDSEDPSGWFQIGRFKDQVYQSESAALSDALIQIPWLKEIVAPN
jgi:hypothetical protein